MTGLMTDEPSESRMAVKKRERAGAILDAAFACFDEFGFKNTTMAMIAGKADMSVGSLYNYHNSKEELLLNGILLSREGYAKEIAELALHNYTGEERWMRLTGIYLASFSRYSKRVWREFMATVFSDAPERIGDIEHIDMPFIEGIQNILVAYVSPGFSLKSGSIERLTAVIYQLWIQKIFQYMLTDPMTAEEIQNKFLEELRTIRLLD